MINIIILICLIVYIWIYRKVTGKWNENKDESCGDNSAQDDEPEREVYRDMKK